MLLIEVRLTKCHTMHLHCDQDSSSQESSCKPQHILIRYAINASRQNITCGVRGIHTGSMNTTLYTTCIPYISKKVLSWVEINIISSIYLRELL